MRNLHAAEVLAYNVLETMTQKMKQKELKLLDRMLLVTN